MRRIPPIALTLLLAVGLCGGYWALLAVTGVRAQFAEGNFQSNLIRAQSYLFDERPDAALLGSSVSGRLLPEFFAENGVTLANLGLDGGGVGSAIELTQRRPAPPPVVLLEAYSLGRGIEANDRQILNELDGLTFRLGRWLRIMRADARPSSIVYTWMKRRREMGSLAPSDYDVDRGNLPQPIPIPLSPVKPRAEPSESDFGEHLSWLLGKIAALRAAGAQVVIVRLPAGKHAGPPGSWDLADEVSIRAEAPLVDVPDIMRQRGDQVVYTDGLHLAGPSARKASQIIAEAIRPLLAEKAAPTQRTSR